MKADAAWRYGDFRLLWISQIVSESGSAMTVIAVPLIAIGPLHATALEVGLLAASGTIGSLLIGLPAGVIVDRLHRKSVMIFADLFRGLITLYVPVAWALGSLDLPGLFVVALLNSLASVLFDVANQSIVPSIVPRDAIASGNAITQATMSASQTVGPSLGGALIQIVGAPLMVLVDAASFFASAVALRSIRRAEDETGRSRGCQSARRELVDGLNFIRADPVLRSVTVCTSSGVFFAGAWGAVTILFLVREVGVSPAELGLILGVSSLGGILGAVAGSRATARYRCVPLSVVTLLVIGPLGMLMALAGNGPRVFFYVLGAIVVDAGFTMYNVVNLTYRQTVTPNNLLGRVTATSRFLVWGLLPAGGVFGGWFAGVTSARATIALSMLGLTTSAAWLVPQLARERRGRMLTGGIDAEGAR